MISVVARLKFSHLPALSAAKSAAVRRIRHETGLRIEADWKGDVRVDTGNYRRSIHTEDAADRTVISSNTNYAGFNEWGTSTMAARPSATKAAEKHRRLFAADAARVIRGA